jgi:hypothetical protein
MSVTGRTPPVKTWSRRVALPALFVASFAATLGVRLRTGSPQSAVAAPVAAVVPAPRPTVAPAAALPAPSGAAGAAPQVDGKADAIQATEAPPPASRGLPPGASYWPPD